MKLNAWNYMDNALTFQSRQAGVSIIYDHDEDLYTYNAYCLELELMKELFTVEYEELDDALKCINEEFGTWKLQKLADIQDSCATCAK